MENQTKIVSVIGTAALILIASSLVSGNAYTNEDILEEEFTATIVNVVSDDYKEIFKLKRKFSATDGSEIEHEEKRYVNTELVADIQGKTDYIESLSESIAIIDAKLALPVDYTIESFYGEDDGVLIGTGEVAFDRVQLIIDRAAMVEAMSGNTVQKTEYEDLLQEIIDAE